ncbi:MULTISPECIES: hypothetical protein [Ureibacillus]|nr:hypothetical protein [Ureibacillus manganicus]
MAKTKKVKGRLTSIQYVHDPEAANEWMKLLMEITKRQFSERCLNKDKG